MIMVKKHGFTLAAAFLLVLCFAMAGLFPATSSKAMAEDAGSALAIGWTVDTLFQAAEYGDQIGRRHYDPGAEAKITDNLNAWTADTCAPFEVAWG